MREILIPGTVIAVQKEGRLTEDSLRWLNENTGSSFPIEPSPFDQRRELFDPETEITALGFSNGYIFDAVSCDVAEYGIGGSDKFFEKLLAAQAEEEEFDLKRVKEDLGFAACELVIAKPVDDPERKIARTLTSYPNITDRFFKKYLYEYEPIWPDSPRLDWKRQPVRTSVINEFPGSTEMVARRGDYDALVDIRQSGDSLVKNDWERVAKVMDCQAILLTKGKEQNPTVPFAEIPDAVIQTGRLKV